MPQENVEIVRKSYEAFARGDADAAIAAYSEDIEWDDRHFRPEGGIHHGHDELRAVIRSWVGTWSEYHFEVERLIDLGEKVFLIAHERGRGKGSGVEIEGRWAQILTLRDGKIAKTVAYREVDEAMRAAGIDGDA